MVSINEKSKLIKIIQKEQLTEGDKEELRHILSKLPSEELKSLLGKKYELFIKNYMNISDSRESTTEIVNSENEQKVIKKTHTSFRFNVPNFKEKAMIKIPKEKNEQDNSVAFRKEKLIIILKSIVKLISDGARSQDFDDEKTITKIFHMARLPATEAEVDRYKIRYRTRYKRTLEKKRNFIKLRGKILSDFLIGDINQQEIKEKYNISQKIILNLVRYLREYHHFDSELRFPKGGHNLIIYDDEFRIVLEKNLNALTKFIPLLDLQLTKNQIINKGLFLYDYAIQNEMSPSDMGTRKNAGYLSVYFIYFALLYLGVNRFKGIPLSMRLLCKWLSTNVSEVGLSENLCTDLSRAGHMLKFLPKNQNVTKERIFSPSYLDYNTIKKFVELVGLVLITTEKEFKDDSERPSFKTLEIRCPLHSWHEWKTTYNRLYHQSARCPHCTKGKYEKIICFYHQKIFKKDFLSKGLRYIIPSYNGQMIFDGYDVIPMNFYASKNHFIDNSDIIADKIPNYVFKKVYKINNLNFKKDIAVIEKDLIVNNSVIFEKLPLLILFPFGYIILVEGFERNKKVIKVHESKLTIKKDIKIENKLLLAFEMNGHQHYYFPNRFKSNVNDLTAWLIYIINDLIKLYLSVLNGIVTIIFPYDVSLGMVSPKRIQDFIVNKFRFKTGVNLYEYGLKQFDHRKEVFLIKIDKHNKN